MRNPDVPFDEPWQAQLFALTLSLNEAGAFDWPEWVSSFGKELATREQHAADNSDYWAAWLAALERFLVERKITSSEALSGLADAWHSAARATPHGQPISLKNAPQA